MRYQQNILRLGVLGALEMRGLLIGGGVYLLDRFQWVTYFFVALLLISAVRLLVGSQRERDLIRESCNVCDPWIARVVLITPSVAGGRFLQGQGGRLAASPLLVALIVIETTDLMFALDSVPAVLAITRVPFTAHSSTAFAMLGLRSLYFLLAAAVDRFRYLQPGLAAILALVAAKMLLEPFVHVGVTMSLVVIACGLVLAVGASCWSEDRRRRDVPAPTSEAADKV